MRVIVTRPQREAQLWVRDLMAAGIQAWALPLIEIRAVADTRLLQEYWQQIGTYAGVMFVSGNAAQHFFAVKPRGLSAFVDDSAIKTRAWATGPGTVAALRSAGVGDRQIDSPTARSPQFDSEALWQVVHDQVHEGDRVLIVRGGQANALGQASGVGRDWFAAQVQSAGGNVDFAVAYERVAPMLSQEDLRQITRIEPAQAIWLLSSSEALANLLSLCPRQSWAQSKAIATHPRIGEMAKAAGFGVVCVSRPTMDEIIASIESFK